MTNPTVQLAAFRARAAWVQSARPNQIIYDDPDDSRDNTLFMAGRGFGKTRIGAEDAWWYSWENPGSIYHVIAPTRDSDLKGVCFEGESGILSVIPYECLAGGIDKAYNKSELSIKLSNGSVIKGFSATEPNRLRGPQCHRLWGDEFAAWENFRPGNAKEVLDMALMGLRLGDRSRAILTTTPKPLAVIRALMADPAWKVVRGTTYDNLANLSNNFRERILKYEGTKLGRQEIYAEVLDLEEGGVISRSQFRLWPASKPLPRFTFIVFSLDTAFTEATTDRRTHDPDPTACSVWGVFVHEGKANVMLLDRWADLLGYPALVARVRDELKNSYGEADQPLLGKPLLPVIDGPPVVDGSGRKVDMTIIEKKGSGISLIQSLADEGIHAFPYNPGNESKLTRLHIVSPVFAANMVWVVESNNNPGSPRTWAEPLIAQVCSFRGEGTIEHDDDVDTTTQALRVMMDKKIIRVPMPKLPVTEPRAPDKAYSNPYAA